MAPPVATYRLQLDPAQLRLPDVPAIVPYLERLGISHLYASPIFAARTGSRHGYDIVDPNRVNPALGGEEALRAVAASLAEHGLGMLIDVVPNHMAATTENPWWVEVLEHGSAAPHAGAFDVDWAAGPILLPVLAERYSEALERGLLTPAYEGGRFVVGYGEHRFPLAPGTYRHVLGERPPRALRRLSEGLASSDVRRSEEAKDRLQRLVERRRRIRALVDRRLEELRDPDRLHDLLERQPYRLVCWELSLERLSYRRFFDIVDLVGIRVEDPRVFAETHRLTLRLLAAGLVQGLRIDHVDGLRDPLVYLERLRSRSRRDRSSREGALPPSPSREREGEQTYLVVEKILAPTEALPDEWPVDGTTGYEFLNALNQVFVDPEGLLALRSLYTAFTGSETGFEELVHSQKRRLAEERFGAELDGLADGLAALAADDRRARDVLPSRLRQALLEVTAALPVYRTYIRGPGVEQRDREVVERALSTATERRPELDGEATAFLRRVLLLEEDRASWLRWVMDWQQLSGAVMAKGLEDTALYVYNPLLSLNEVGGNPGAFPDDPVLELHRRNRLVAEHRTMGLNATSTHDTKRSEDVRARIGVLSQLPGTWGRCLDRWHELNRRHRETVDGLPVPTPNEEIFLYQTLLGAWPLDGDVEGLRERLDAYLVKAAREAKVNTRWIEPDRRHEKALVRFAGAILEDPAFREDFDPLQEIVAYHGMLAALAQRVLQVASPGVPDLYQGTELWDLSLADPDNRRPVDFRLRIDLLEELERRASDEDLATELLSNWRDGRIKLHVTRRALRARARHPALFREGGYLPLTVEGPRARHVVAFARGLDDEWAVAAVPHLTVDLAEEGPPLGEEVWEDTLVRLPADAPEAWRDAVTARELESPGDEVRVATLFAATPLAILTSA